MNQNEKPGDSRRIELRIDHDKRDYLSKRARDYADIINSEVIPTIAPLGLPVDKEAVMRYAADFDAMRREYVEGRRAASEVEGDFLNLLAVKEAAADFDRLTRGRRYPDTTTRYPELVVIDEDGAREDTAAVREAATVYVEGAALAAYDRHQKAVEAINEFFRGKAPEGWEGLANYFPVVDGVVKAGSLINYNKYV